MYEYAPATEDHVRALAERIRPADADEIRALGFDPLDGLLRTFRVSRDTTTALVDGRVVSVYGMVVPSLLSDAGLPWMIGAAELPRHKKELLRTSSAWVSRMRREYRYLCNYVDARHHAAIRWLRWLGFAIHPAEPFGPRGLPFHKFDLLGNKSLTEALPSTKVY